MNHQSDLSVGSRCPSVCVCVSWTPEIISFAILKPKKTAKPQFSLFKNRKLWIQILRLNVNPA